MTDQSAISHPSATTNIAGDQSGYWCANETDALVADAFLAVCDGELLVSDYWVSVQVGDVDGISRSQLGSAIVGIMKEVATKLAAAPAPTTQWYAPGATPQRFCSDSGTTATVRTIFGDSTFTAITVGNSALRASTIGLSDVYSRCFWRSQSGNSVGVLLLAGGSWIFPAFAPVPVGDVLVHSYSPVTVAGATPALLGCDQGSCDAYLGVGATAVEISMDDAGSAKNLAVLAGMAKAIAAA